jgi:hypothetical protein
MTVNFVRNIFCVGVLGLTVFGVQAGEARWLSDPVVSINWQAIRLEKQPFGDRLRKKGFLGKKKYSRAELCDLACACVTNILRLPHCFKQSVPGHSFTYEQFLSAIRLSLNDKAVSKSSELQLVIRLVDSFSALMSNPDNHQYISGFMQGDVDSRRALLRVLQAHIEGVKQIAAVRIIDPYKLETADSAIGNALPAASPAAVLPALLGELPGQQPQGLLVHNQPLVLQEYPGACPACLPQEMPAASQAPTQSPQVQNKVGPYTAAVVIGAALTGLLIDCAVRRQRSWLVRATHATGRAFRSLWRWLKMPGRPTTSQ